MKLVQNKNCIHSFLLPIVFFSLSDFWAVRGEMRYSEKKNDIKE